MANVAEAFVTLRPDTDRFGGEMKSKLGGLAGIAGKAALGIGAAFVGAAGAGLKAFSNLQSGMNEVFTLLPGISEDAMSEMTGQVKQFSKDFGVLPDEVVPALYQSLSAGVPQENVFEFLETANKAAVGGVTDLETAVDGISSVVNSYGEDVVDAAEASDLMFTAVKLGKTNFEELSQSLFNVLPTASSLGVKFEDVTAAMAELTSQGVPTSVATTQMRQLFVELSKEGGKASDTFKEMAGQTFQEFIAEGGNTADALDIMRDAAEESGLSLSDMFGSVEAGAAALSLAGEDTEGYREALDEMQKSAGATEEAHGQMDQGLSRAWDRIKTNVMVALTDIGEELAPTFQVFADWVVDNMPAITDTVVGTFRTIAQGVQRLGEIFGPVFAAISETIALVVDIWNDPDITSDGWVGTVERVVVGFITFRDTVTEIIDTVMGLFRSNSDDMQSTANETWASITGIFQSYADAVIGIVTWFTNIATKFWERFGTHIVQFIKGSWENIKQLIDAALRVIKGIFDVFAGVFTGDWTRAWEGVKAIFSGVWSAIHAILSQAIEAIKLVLGAAVAAISQIWESIWNTVKTLARNAWDAIVGIVREKIEDTKAEIRAIKDFVVGFFSGAGTWLKSAGRAILDGLFNGLKEKWSELRDWVGGLGSKIKNLKGPLPEDKRMLKDEGRAIIEGLGRGMQDEWSSIERLLGTLTAEIPAHMPSGPGHAAVPGAGQVNVKVYIGNEEFNGRIRAEIDRHDGDMLVGLRKGPR